MYMHFTIIKMYNYDTKIGLDNNIISTHDIIKYFRRRLIWTKIIKWHL